MCIRVLHNLEDEFMSKCGEYNKYIFVNIWPITRTTCRGACREQPSRGASWVSGFVGHFFQTWPDSECSHTVQFLDSAVLRL